MVIVGSGGPYNYSPPLMHQINITAAVAGCLTLSASYVASLYIWPGALYAARDDPQTIRQRMVSVSLVAIISPCVISSILTMSKEAELHLSDSDHRIPFYEAFDYLARTIGLSPQAGFISWRPILLTFSLFFGPIVLKLLDAAAGKPLFSTGISSAQQWLRLRNFVVAPITEEVASGFCFSRIAAALTYSGMIALGRGFCCALGWVIMYVAAGLNRMWLCTAGVAHLHHGWELTRQGYPPSVAAVNVLFQLAYTTLFGSFVSYVFLRTGQLATVVVLHSFCNWMGFPDFARMAAHPRRGLLLACLFGGIGVFVGFFTRWTR